MLLCDHANNSRCVDGCPCREPHDHPIDCGLHTPLLCTEWEVCPGVGKVVRCREV